MRNLKLIYLPTFLISPFLLGLNNEKAKSQPMEQEFKYDKNYKKSDVKSSSSAIQARDAIGQKSKSTNRSNGTLTKVANESTQAANATLSQTQKPKIETGNSNKENLDKSPKPEDEAVTCIYPWGPGYGNMMRDRKPIMGMGGGMMGGGMMGGGMMGGGMYTDDVDLNISQIDNGVILKWTSADPEVQKRIKTIAERMKVMHTAMGAGKTDVKKN